MRRDPYSGSSDERKTEASIILPSLKQLNFRLPADMDRSLK